MWSESGAGIDVGPLGALETWHEKGEAPKEHAGTKQELRWQGISSVCLSKDGYIRRR